MRNRYAVILLSCLLAHAANAQYCSPTFSSGCFTWTNQSVTVGSIHWTLGANDCSLSDYTNLSTTVSAGVSIPMTVVNGNWCGCSVWVDLNNDGTFQDSENLYHTYVGGDPSYTYSFHIILPQSTPAGAYRMRVVAAWGSDGFTAGDNGSGPCGSYQYGNFDDFTLNVGDVAQGISDIGTADHAITIAPNPTTGRSVLSTDATAGLERIIVRSADGRIVQQLPVADRALQVELDLSALPAGAYVVQCLSASASRSMKVIKQ